jgi:hypothetical protein
VILSGRERGVKQVARSATHRRHRAPVDPSAALFAAARRSTRDLG